MTFRTVTKPYAKCLIQWGPFGVGRHSGREIACNSKNRSARLQFVNSQSNCWSRALLLPVQSPSL